MKIPKNKHPRLRRGVRRLRDATEALQKRALDRLSEPKNVGPAVIEFEGASSVTVEPGTTLLSAAQELELDLDHYCGGNCSCGTCRVEVLEGSGNLSKIEPMESMVLGITNVERGHRLACQARVNGPVRICIPDWF